MQKRIFLVALPLTGIEAGQAVEEDPHLWELSRQLKPDQAVILGE
jgi:hypothetical protein